MPLTKRSTWRGLFSPLVYDALETGRSLPLEGDPLRRWAYAQSPWREWDSGGYAHRIWCSEVRRQLGLGWRLHRNRPRDARGQMVMFQGGDR